MKLASVTIKNKTIERRIGCRKGSPEGEQSKHADK
jgi:hypothetical protein